MKILLNDRYNSFHLAQGLKELQTKLANLILGLKQEQEIDTAPGIDGPTAPTNGQLPPAPSAAAGWAQAATNGAGRVWAGASPSRPAEGGWGTEAGAGGWAASTAGGSGWASSSPTRPAASAGGWSSPNPTASGWNV